MLVPQKVSKTCILFQELHRGIEFFADRKFVGAEFLDIHAFGVAKAACDDERPPVCVIEYCHAHSVGRRRFSALDSRTLQSHRENLEAGAFQEGPQP